MKPMLRDHLTMTWDAFSTTVLPLLGVLLGTCGTLLGQYLATRVDSKRLEHDRLAAMRAERKAAILSFLDAAQRVELILDKQPVFNDRSDDNAAQEELHKLWLAKKTVELVCSPELAQCAQDYTSALHIMLRNPDQVADPAAKRETRYLMMESARRDLGIAGAALKRGLPQIGTGDG
ncbi:hypothetical protein ACIBF6_45005 [Streptosporangium amethystogenes]|uniref:hypothetical protein n=1 Tax=Streptosporangium amethystogenes TaxID=2002 RepID=UPI00379CF75C